MKKITAILFLSFLLFVVELFLTHYVHSGIMPNLLLLLVIFVNLWLGIRYSILAAVMCGLFRDSFSADFFGLHIFVLLVCAYMTTLLARYVYQRGSSFSRYVLVSCLILISFFLQFFLHVGVPDVHRSFVLILLPQFILTLLLMEFVFKHLRLCASRFFV